MKRKLLIIEDEVSLAKQIKWGLHADYDVIIAENVQQARKLLSTQSFPVATLDLGLPPTPDTAEEGFHLLKALPELAPDTKAIVITGNDEQENAIKAVALGAVDFCAKPIDLKLLEVILDRAYKISSLEEANRRLQETGRESSLCGMHGVSQVMGELFQYIRKVSRTHYPVLILGESGTGKEMVAKAVHQLSKRKNQPMVTINCGAIPESLLESELFGHEKGAFTGAASKKIGRFEDADKGTIFLDEIGDMPMPLQVKILRFLQEDTIERVGGNITIKLDVRIIAATNVELEEAVREGRFREDLFFRLNVVPINVPSLNERQEDILLLANHFITEEAQKLRRVRKTLSHAAAAALTARTWTGNVRELQNLIRRAIATSAGKMITPADLGFDENMDTSIDQPLLTIKEARQAAEVKAVRRALMHTNNNISKAAKLLEISRPTLHDMINKYNILQNS
jgi:two-component system NtrC family response regulator